MSSFNQIPIIEVKQQIKDKQIATNNYHNCHHNIKIKIIHKHSLLTCIHQLLQKIRIILMNNTAHYFRDLMKVKEVKKHY